MSELFFFFKKKLHLSFSVSYLICQSKLTVERFSSFSFSTTTLHGVNKHFLAGSTQAAELAGAACRRGLQLPKNKEHALLSANMFPSQVFARTSRKYNKVFLLWKTRYQQSCALVNIAYPAPG